MGMDWHSSGITTSVVGALKRGLAPIQHELGIYVCGDKGAHSRRTPQELMAISDMIGVDAISLARFSRPVAKIDGCAVQDGYDLYLHAFFATRDGQWCVVQQGMNDELGEARRYHWQSEGLAGFFESPHAAIEGCNVGAIVNLADVRASDVLLRRLHGTLAATADLGPKDFARIIADTRCGRPNHRSARLRGRSGARRAVSIHRSRTLLTRPRWQRRPPLSGADQGTG